MSTVLVLYYSQEHGNTKAMAEAVAEGAAAAGAEVNSINTNEQRLDIDEYRRFDAVAFGSPDYFGYIAGGLKVFMDDWYIAQKTDRGGTGRQAVRALLLPRRRRGRPRSVREAVQASRFASR